MTRFFELTGFVALSVLLHLVIAMEIEDEDGANASGDGGTEMINLAASSASVETMVEQWEAPPPVETRVAQPSPMVWQPDQAPARPSVQFDLAPDRSAAISLPSAQPEQSDLPQVDLSATEPPKPPEPEPEPVEEVETPPDVVEEPAAEPEPQQTATATSRRPKKRPQHLEQQPEPEPRKTAEPAPVAKPQSAASNKQTAAGTGGGSQAGNAGKAQVATLSNAQKAKLEAIWGGQIRNRIERRKRSPRGARGEGRVVLSITVARSGQVLKVGVARSSGNPLFDQAALQAVSRAGNMPGAPDGLTNASYGFMLPMDFR